MSICFPKILSGVALAAAVAFSVVPATAQGTDAVTSAEAVRAEISQAIDAIATYSEEQGEQAVTEARAALDRLDSEIETREQALREGWAEMSEEARKTARAQLQDLRKARNRLGERFGALQAGTASAWDELKAGFADAWDAFSEVWSDTEDKAAKN
ncbi:hypothetical protein [Lutimaribacter saemankumensis]|uniref:Uncharacterized protein n=1 Tax=Lutimaribacter saemankumensis TaxID=490829 RepID=A0A1G8TMW0_9RHOB|nr:hypothetical protein [Lutimaribacter saemankumensis]SDJ42872.1 hypothetical protein SAMN05421850_1278 [Lutimaribacter saemankumensis]